jgi:hydrogenase maturation protein HypF
MRAGVEEARRLHITGVVQGVGFRPFVYRLATESGLRGWVLNGQGGVEIHVEGDRAQLDEFAAEIRRSAPPAARIASFETLPAQVFSFERFEIRESVRSGTPTVRVCADLPVCASCLRELFDPNDRRYRYPYINCTDCGPRYSIVRGLPYDRPQTTMRDWPMCRRCREEYEDPADRRFHAQPVACPRCGPEYALEENGQVLRGYPGIERAAEALRSGAVVAIKGLGGYHLACDARNADAVTALRERKYRKERPFALMVRDVPEAAQIVEIDERADELLTSTARPIVLARACADLPGVAPDCDEFGVMLAYTPVQHLLFDAGAPPVLVMTSANRSSEPIAYRDEDARRTLSGIADAMLVGEREIARRMDDSVVSAIGVIRHARGYAPQAVATLPCNEPIAALGADLKSAVALVVDGQAFVSQHIGDLEYLDAFESFRATIADLTALYELPLESALIAHDAHPEYRSSQYAAELGGRRRAVQHHRAHIASVLAEREAFEIPVLGFAFDGTGYGEDGSIWGGEVFGGSLRSGLTRVAHLRGALLPGGDAAALFPVQAAAGFLHDAGCSDATLTQPPFHFPARYREAQQLLRRKIRTFPTTSMGRLFDTVAALLGFTRPITFEAQAAMWLEYLARRSAPVDAYQVPFENGELDYRPLLTQVIEDRRRGRSEREIARAFHGAVASAMIAVVNTFEYERIVISGGVFQNRLLVALLHDALGERLWMNRVVPPNDGGVCLGQAAIAAVQKV